MENISLEKRSANQLFSPEIVSSEMGLPVSALLHRESTVLFIIAEITRNPQWWSNSGRLFDGVRGR
jgi:hypothetical protein